MLSMKLCCCVVRQTASLAVLLSVELESVPVNFNHRNPTYASEYTFVYLLVLVPNGSRDPRTKCCSLWVTGSKNHEPQIHYPRRSSCQFNALNEASYKTNIVH
jgi:hypothetical protein